MSEDKNLDEIYQEIVDWEDAFENIQKNITHIETSTKRIINWIQENETNLQHIYFDLVNASFAPNLSEKDIPKAIEKSGDLQCLLLRMPLIKQVYKIKPPYTNMGISLYTIIDNMSKNANDDIHKIIQNINEDFPAYLTETTETTEKKETKNKSKKDRIKKLEEKIAAEVKKSWWQTESSFESDKKKFLMEQLEKTKSEVLDIETSKPFYIDSFFEWVKANRGLRGDDVPGEGRLEDFINDTYRNPDYILTQVYNDCNESIQAVFDNVKENVIAYFMIKYGLLVRNIGIVKDNIDGSEDRRKILSQILQEEGKKSLLEYMIDELTVPTKSNLFIETIQEMPDEVFEFAEIEDKYSKKNQEKAFNKIFAMVVNGNLEPCVLKHTADAIRAVCQEDYSISEYITDNIKSYTDKILELSEKDRAKAKSISDEIMEIAGVKEEMSFVSSFSIALYNKDVDIFCQLLDEASEDDKKNWLKYLKKLKEHNEYNLIQALLQSTISISDKARMITSAHRAGATAFNYREKNKINNMRRELREAVLNIKNKSNSKNDKDANFAIFSVIQDFIFQNTNTEEYINIIADIQTSSSSPISSSSILEMVVDSDANNTDKAKILEKLFSGFTNDIKVAAATYRAAEVSKKPQIQEYLFNIADKIVGENIKIEKDRVQSVIYPEKLTYIYHAYERLGYGTTVKDDESTVAISEEDTKIYMDILSKRKGALKIGKGLVYPKNFSLVVIDKKLGQIEFLRNSIDKIAFKIEKPEEIDKLSEEIANICNDDNYININNSIIVNTASFESILYNSTSEQLTVNREFVLPEISLEDFDKILAKLKYSNKDIFYMEDMGLVINTALIDAVYEDKKDTEYQISSSKILINGQNVDVFTFFNEEVISSVIEAIKKQAGFLNIASVDNLHVNTNRVAFLKSEDAGIVTIATNKNRYIENIPIEEGFEWLNARVISESVAIEKRGSKFIFDIMGEEIAIDKSDLSSLSVAKNYKKITDNFYCKADNIPEIVFDKNNKQLTVKTSGSEIIIATKNIEKIAKQFGVNTKKATQKSALSVKEIASLFNKGALKSKNIKTKTKAQKNNNPKI